MTDRNIPHRPLRRTGTLMCGCATLALLAARPAWAQDAETVVLSPIVVEATGGDDDASSIVATETASDSGLPTDILDTPASVSVITEKEIEQRGAVTLEQVLQYTSGVTSDFYGSDDRFDYFKIRGFDAFTYRDGLLIGAPFGGIREEPYAFQRVEVLKGSNSTAFGVADPGGAVNFVTKTPTGERLREAYLSYGSFSQKELGFDLGDKLNETGTLSWRLTGKILDGEGEADGTNDDEAFLMAGLAWRPSDRTQLTFVFDYLYRDGYPNSGGYPLDIDFDRSTFLGEPEFNYLDTDRKTATLKFDHDFGGGLSLGATARYSRTEHGYGYLYVNSAADLDLTDTVTPRAAFANDSLDEDFVADAHLRYDRSFGSVQSRTLAGVEYRHSEADSRGWYADNVSYSGIVYYPYPASLDIDWTNPVRLGGIDLSLISPISDTSTDTTVKAIYLQEELTFSERVIANLGLRRDWIDTTETNNLSATSSSGSFAETTGRFGLTYKITNGLSVYGSYAESVVPASVGVEPERGEQYELGVKYRPEGMRALFSAAVYDLTKLNMSVTDPVTMLPATIGETRSRGLDLEARAELSDRMNLTAAYSYIDTEIVENGTGGNAGNELSLVPKHSASLWVDYRVPGTGRRRDMTFGLGARYTGSYWLTNANARQSDSAVIVDAAFSYDLADNFDLQVNVSNLFDEKHVTYGGFSGDYYNPGRKVTVSLRSSW